MSFQYEDKYGNQLHAEGTKGGGVYLHVADSEGGVGLEIHDHTIWDLINFLLKVAP